MAIRRLPSAVVSSLRTDVTVTTSAQCVAELVLNSIDAGATAVAVRVNLPNFQIQVIDNGDGISLSDMNVIGTRYMTSKCSSLQDLQTNLSHFGFRGEALTSISDVSGTFTISSRHRNSDETFCKVFTQGIPHKVGKSRQPRASCGTTITVSDFLYNRPVRRARIKPALDLEDIKIHLESIALINYKVSFSLRNNVNNEMILQTQQANDIPTIFGNLFGSDNAKNLIPVKESFGPFRVKGYISSEAHFLKNLQFIFINQRLLLKTKLHKLVNSLMSRSAILKSNNVPHVPISKEINHGVFLAFSPPKRDKHAVFVLDVVCPFSEYDITLDPKKTLIEFCDWDSLLSCFEQLLRKFIEHDAGAHAGKEIYDKDPPKKFQTVVDEINQLAREEGLNKQGNQSPQEMINIRAVHSIPVRRNQVKLPPDPSGVPSTSFCGHSSQDEESICGTNTVLNSVFTEKPYPPLSKNLLGKSSDTLKSKYCSFSTDSEISARLQESTVKDARCINKNLLGEKKVVKGFITSSIQFEENFPKDLDGCCLGRSRKLNELPEASPVDALANIKEVRRKKLLKNLDKFSFKPVLHKVPLSAKVSRPISQKVNEVPKVMGDWQVYGSKLLAENLKESKAVQTTFSLPTSPGSKSITSLVATCQSSVNLISVGDVGKSSAVSSFCLQHDKPLSFPVDDERGVQKGEASCNRTSKNMNVGVQSSELWDLSRLDEESSRFPSQAKSQKLERNVSSKFPEPDLNISHTRLSIVAQDSDLVGAENKKTQKRIVDYDSSPSLSEESLSSANDSSPHASDSPSKLKRRCNIQSEQVSLKRFCTSTKTECVTSEVQHSPCINAECLQSNHIALDESSMGSSKDVQISTQQNESDKCLEENWARKVDDSGEPFYIHNESGITTYCKPNEKKPGTFKMSDRFMFLPKGMSPIFKDKLTNEISTSPNRTFFQETEDPSAIKWGANGFGDSSCSWPLVDQLLTEANKFSESQCLESQISNATSNDQSQAQIKVYNAIFPQSFSKEIFHNLEVLGQLDNKFIVALASVETNKKIILLFDQHAVHERIRVESLTSEYRVHDGSSIWKSSPVEPALPLSLSSIEVRILQSYKNKMEDLGFSFSPIDSNTISVLRVPTCLLLRENREVTCRGVSVLRQHLESLIREQVDSLLNTRGVGTVHPSIIRNVISSEACKGAVKFGHPLSVADCQAFLHNLSECDLPFQCAHGRPALMPIIDLSQLKSRLSSKPNLQKLRMMLKKT